MSWAVFWVDPKEIGPQLGLAATSMLTLIAFQFAFTGLLPRISYLTRADRFVFSASLLVFLALVETGPNDSEEVVANRAAQACLSAGGDDAERSSDSPRKPARSAERVTRQPAQHPCERSVSCYVPVRRGSCVGGEM